MNLEELNPAAPELDISGKKIKFSLFTLYVKAWSVSAFSTKEQPNGIANLSEGLRVLDKLIIARLAWKLVKNKRDISEEEFFDYAERRENILEILKVVNKILELSQPSQKNNDRMKELKKS